MQLGDKDLGCSACRQTGPYAVVTWDDVRDGREHINREDDAKVQALVDQGWTERHVTMADDLPLQDQLRYLRVAWEALFPADQARLVDPDEWEADDDDPDVSSLQLTWDREPAAEPSAGPVGPAVPSPAEQLKRLQARLLGWRRHGL